jgi:Stress responsive A/B Barrel Domain
MEPEQTLRHIVLLAFNPSTSAEEIAAVEQAFRALPAMIAAIADLEWGSAANSGSTYTHCLMITFHTAADLEDYNNHPAHQAIAIRYGPLVQRDLVADYWIAGEGHEA